MDTLTIIIRFAIVFVLSAILGIERQRAHKPVSFGTFVFVAIGSCALVIVTTIIDFNSRILVLGSIVTGIGFLGAGALIKGSDRVFGFTTATSIWLFAIFGLIIGLGYYTEGFIVYVSVWLVVGVDKYLENRGIGTYRKKVTITYTEFNKKEQIANILADYCTRFTLMNVNMDKKQKTISSGYLVEGPKKEISYLLKELYKNKWCVSVKFE